MIKVKTFNDFISADLDFEIEDFIADRNIKREDIIKVYFYAIKHEDGVVYHYCKLVYENGQQD